MDSDRFDQLARSLSAASTRRTIVRFLATVPVAGGLLTRLTTPDAVLGGKDGKHGKHGKGGKHGKDRQTPGRTGKEPSGTSRVVGFCASDIRDLAECDAR